MGTIATEDYQAVLRFIVEFARVKPNSEAIYISTLKATFSNAEWAGLSLSHRKAALRSLLGFSLDESNPWYPDIVAKVDEALKAANCLTLSQARMKYSRKLAQILRKPKVRVLGDFLYLHGMLNSGLLSQEDAAVAKALVDEAEGKSASNWSPLRKIILSWRQ